MRLMGLLLILLGVGMIYELYYKGLTIAQALANVATTFGLPASSFVHPITHQGAPTPGVSAATNATQAGGGTLRPGKPS
jgi:hypothetical protein